jgi:hypothetical protein
VKQQRSTEAVKLGERREYVLKIRMEQNVGGSPLLSWTKSSIQLLKDVRGDLACSIKKNVLQ